MKELLLAMALLAVPPVVDIPAQIRPSGQYATLSPKTEAVSITYIGLSGIEPLPSAMLKDSRMFLLDTRGLPVGSYKFVAVASLKDEHVRIDFAVVIGTPPGPDPINPINPINPPPPSPGPLTRMRVLILEETSPSSARPLSQHQALHASTVIAYLDKKANESSGIRRWRRLDPHATVTNLSKEWQILRAKATPASPDQPWVVIAGESSAGGGEQVVFSGPYPATEDEALALFKKWGG